MEWFANSGVGLFYCLEIKHKLRADYNNQRVAYFRAERVDQDLQTGACSNTFPFCSPIPHKITAKFAAKVYNNRQENSAFRRILAPVE